MERGRREQFTGRRFFQIDQHCAVSIRLDGTYIPPELRPLLQQQRPLHLHVTTQDAFSFESNKRFSNVLTFPLFFQHLNVV